MEDAPSRFRDYLLAARARHEVEIRRIDAELERMGEEPLPRRTPAACVAILASIGAPASPRVVAERLRERGRDASNITVNQALHRLHKAGEIDRPEPGKYAARAPEKGAG